MRTTYLLRLCLPLLLLASACGGGESAGNDAAQDAAKDGATSDQQIQNDQAPPPPDFTLGPFNCGATLICIAACNVPATDAGAAPPADGGVAACEQFCRDTACANGLTAYGAIETCRAASCAVECTNNDQACNTCIGEKCLKQLTLCNLDRCTGEAPPQLKCGDLSLCLLACGDDNACKTTCSGFACANAETKRQAAATCITTASAPGGDCALQCLIPSPICNDCVANKCQASFQTCENDTCP